MGTRKVIEELENRYAEMQKEIGVKTSLDELDEVFFIRDMVQQNRFVSTSLSRMVCARIRDTFTQWIGQLHSWLVPNPQNLLSVGENGLFDEEEKNDIMQLINTYMAFITENVVIGLSKDKEKEREFIDNALVLWNANKDKLIHYTTKVHEHWKAHAPQE